MKKREKEKKEEIHDDNSWPYPDEEDEDEMLNEYGFHNIDDDLIEDLENE